MTHQPGVYVPLRALFLVFYLSIYLFIYLFIYLSIYLSILYFCGVAVHGPVNKEVMLRRSVTLPH